MPAKFTVAELKAKIEKHNADHMEFQRLISELPDGPDKKELQQLLDDKATPTKESAMKIPAKIGVSLMYEADGVTRKDDSFSAICMRICMAVQKAIDDGQDMDLDGSPDVGMYASVMDVFPDTAIYSLDGDMFQVPYTDDGEMVTLGTPVEVEMSYSVVPDDSAMDAEGDAMESSRALIGTVVQLEESAYDKTKGELTVTIMKPGFSKNKTEGRQRYYPAATLKRDHKIFEGAKMFADHQTDREAKDRPEGSVNNWVAQIGKVWAESDGRVRGTAQVIDPPFKAKLDALNEKALLKEMGISVRIGAEVSKAEIDGQEAMSIDSILSNRSVDFVTYAGAGGAVEMMESASDSENDLELATEAQFRKRRPDLVELIESKSNGRRAHAMKTIEEKLIDAQNALAAEKVRADAAEVKATKLQETSDTQVENIKTLTTKIEESETAAQKVAAASELKTLLESSQLAKLPDAIKAMAFSRVTSQFKEALTNEGMKEAVSAEEAYVKSMNGPAKVTKMGVQDNAVVERKTNLKEAFMRRGMPEKEAEIAAAGR